MNLRSKTKPFIIRYMPISHAIIWGNMITSKPNKIIRIGVAMPNCKGG